MAFLLLASILPLTAFSSPLPSIQAGGPSIIPIPSSCNVTNPLPYSDGYMPSANFTSANVVYSAYYDSPGEPSAVAQQCFEQCHGLSGCKSAFSGYQIPTPKGYYGTAGGELEIGCIMFGTFMAPGDFVPAPEGQYQNSSAANISCPGRAVSTMEDWIGKGATYFGRDMESDIQCMPRWTLCL